MELIATIRKERQNISALRIREQGKRLARIISSDFVLSDRNKSCQSGINVLFYVFSEAHATLES